ncbi:MAG: potassium channel family protein [Phycisphaerales bacterium JB038]
MPGSKRPKTRAQIQTLELRRRAILSVLVLAFVIFAGALGFDILGKERTDYWQGLWDTLNIISTVGSLPNMTRPEQAWGIVVIVVGLSTFLYLYGNVLTLLFSGEVMRVYERRKMERRIEALSNHFVICGYGNTGRVVAADLAKAGEPLVVIDREVANVEEAVTDGHLALQGDCTQDSVLLAAGLDRARSALAALNNDAANVFVTLSARQINPKLHLVSRAEEEATVSKLERAGADRVAVPGRIAALQMSHMLLKPAVTDFIIDAMRGSEFDMRQLAVKDFPWMAGKSLIDLNLPREHQVIVVALYKHGERGQRGTHEFNPSPHEQLNADDVLVVVCEPAAYTRLQATSKSAPD